MAYAKMCDRCRSFYPYDPTDEPRYEITDTEKLESLRSNRGVLDLCPACYEKLLKFIANEIDFHKSIKATGEDEGNAARDVFMPAT